MKDRKLSELFETELKWAGKHTTQVIETTCHSCGHTKKEIYKRPQSPGKWVCKYCNKDQQRKYIATGHDHTDYSYAVCDCKGARKNGKPYSKLT